MIDPATYKVVDRFTVGALPQHVVPAYDLAHLYVTNDAANSLTVIDPRTARPVRTIPVDDPYNMYFTPDGRYAIVVAERLQRLDFRDAHSFALVKSVTTPCRGVDHMDFTADGTKALVSCEFSGQLLELDVSQISAWSVSPAASGLRMPQDVKLSPDGRVFYVADMLANGVWMVDARTFRVIGFVHTGARRARALPEPQRARSLRHQPRRGNDLGAQLRDAQGRPDMADPRRRQPGHGRCLRRRQGALAVRALQRVRLRDLDRHGKLLARIPVGAGPHGLCVWPQPGRYSLGHTGILR